MRRSRKYSYLPHGRSFCQDSLNPLEILIKLDTFLKMFWSQRLPPLLRQFQSVLKRENEYFLELLI